MTGATRKTLNPLAKLILLVVFSVLVILIAEPVYMASLAVFAVALELAYGRRSLVSKAIVSFAAMIFLVQILFNHTGQTLAAYLIFTVTEGGIRTGVVFSGKFLALIAMSWLFVSTTKPSSLSAALTSAGFPYRYAFLPALSMRYVPVFQLELTTVREAQSTRGLELDGSFRGLLRAARYTTMPMLVSAMSKVNTLAASMTGRGFGVSSDRTLLEPCRMTRWDAAMVAAATALAAAFFVCNLTLRIWS